MFCKNCGHKLNVDDIFCESCGSKIKNEKTEQGISDNTQFLSEDPPTVMLDDDSPTVKLDSYTNVMSDDEPTVMLENNSDIMSEDAPTVKLDYRTEELSEDALTVRLDNDIEKFSEDAPTVKLDDYSQSTTVKKINQKEITPKKIYSENSDKVKSGSSNKYAVPIVICSFIFITVAFLLIAFCFNLFGFKSAVAELINGDDSNYSEAFSDSFDSDGTDDAYADETTAATTEPITEATTATTVTEVGTSGRPISADGAVKNLSAKINQDGQCTIVFTPRQTGYYYIQVPIGSQEVTFKTYDNAGNLMGNTEHHKEGSVNEYIYYDMFYAGETYNIVATGNRSADFKISFTDRTNDAHRTVKERETVKGLTSKYTYLRTFTPSKTAGYTMYVKPYGSIGTIRLFDENWNDMNISFSSVDGGKTGVCSSDFERGKKYHFVFYPSGNLEFTIAETCTD